MNVIIIRSLIMLLLYQKYIFIYMFFKSVLLSMLVLNIDVLIVINEMKELFLILQTKCFNILTKS